MNPYRTLYRYAILLLLLAAIVAFTSPTLADIIITVDGGKIVGEIIKEDSKSVTIKTKHGIIHEVDKDDIDEIIRGKTYTQDYEKKLKELKNGDIEGMYALAIWCKENTLRKEYVELILQILEFVPNHSGARNEYRTIKLSLPAEERAKYEKKEVKQYRPPKKAKTKEVKEVEEINPLDEDAKKKIKTLIEEYFADESGAKREEIIKQLVELEPVPKKDLKKYERTIFKKATEGPKIQGSGVMKLSSEKYPGTFKLIMPKRISRKMPLIIGLHGGGPGMGDCNISSSKWAFTANEIGGIAVFPSVIRQVATAWNTEREECYVMELIRQLKRSFPIDPNRVYMCGHSMGGFGTWAIGGHYADVFAALAPCAGGVFFMGSDSLTTGVVPNMKNTPIRFYHGLNDRQVGPKADQLAAEMLVGLKAKYGPFEYVYKEYSGIGHGVPRDGLKPIVQWMAKHKRKPYPEMVVWEPSRAYKKIFYWLKCSAAGGRIVVKRDGNTFEITEGARSGLTIFANDDMIKAGKPVIVKSGDKEIFNGILQPSVSALLESGADKADKEQYFCYRIDL
ncbi:MAG: carboxylesterase family protein [Planctomycetota bacterium]|jgi:predicted peptidase